MATTINAGRVAMVPKGEWDASTAYTRLDVVLYHGSAWVAIQDGTGQEPASGSTYWQLLSLKGEQGEKGDTGATGAQGPAGPQGPSGVVKDVKWDGQSTLNNSGVAILHSQTMEDVSGNVTINGVLKQNVLDALQALNQYCAALEANDKVVFYFDVNGTKYVAEKHWDERIQDWDYGPSDVAVVVEPSKIYLDCTTSYMYVSPWAGAWIKLNEISAREYVNGAKVNEVSIAATGVISKMANGATTTYNLPSGGGTLALASELAGKQDVSPITNAASGALVVNEYRDFGTVSALTVTLTGGTMTNYDLYKFAFTCASDSTTLTLPSGIKLPVDMEMEMAAGRRFECVIDYANCLTFNCWD